jgi:dihydroorotase
MVPSPRRSRSDAKSVKSAEPDQVLAGRAFWRGRLRPVEIGIDEAGRILSVGRQRTRAPRRDVGELVILPAATDLHVHFREPGGDRGAETIATGTVGAALGGVTLVGEMPNTQPPVVDVERLQEKADLVAGRAAVDVLLYASPSDPRALSSLARKAGGFKLYLAPTTGIDSPPDPSQLPGLLERLSTLPLPLAVHAEEPTLFRGGTPPRDPVEWNLRRPPEAETRALERLDGAPDRLRLHVAHVTTRSSVERLREKGRSFEATPHHLLLSDRSGPDSRTKVNPPLRPEAERAALWDSFARGEVPMVASDHAPHTGGAKEVRFELAPSGVPGVETMVPLLLEKVRSGDLSLPVLLAAACDRPARWLGQPLGRIAPGHRANFMIVDFRARAPVRGRDLTSPCGWSPFEGWTAIRPREVWQDGVPIVEGGEYVGRPSGRVVRPDYAEFSVET